MKKLLFTAIAMVAFSSASMANTIAIEEVVLENNLTENEIEIAALKVGPTDCLALKFYYYNRGIAYGLTHDQALAAAYAVYFNCMGQLLPTEPERP
jgi:hypothetical protein